MSSDSSLGRALLKQVSRSFYLTLRLLPKGFREPMSVGYLLARATDTVADTAGLPVDIKCQVLEEMRRLISGGGELQKYRSLVDGALIEIQSHQGERELLLRFGECLTALESQSEPLQGHTRKLMDLIIRGQEEDLTRFAAAEPETVASLSSDEELLRYTYLVAGCVGEFWTEVGLEVDAGFPPQEREKLMALGKRYGQGLQLVNILRDVAEDLALGRCYLPNVEGTVDPSQTQELMDLSKQWSAVARGYLLDGIHYTSCLSGVRLKTATGLPAVIGLRTLDLIDQAPWELRESGIKVSRREVKRLVRRSFFRSLMPGGWRRFDQKRGAED